MSNPWDTEFMLCFTAQQFPILNKEDFSAVSVKRGACSLVKVDALDWIGSNTWKQLPWDQIFACRMTLKAWNGSLSAWKQKTSEGDKTAFTIESLRLEKASKIIWSNHSTSTLSLSIPRDGDSTTSLSNPLQCLTMLYVRTASQQHECRNATPPAGLDSKTQPICFVLSFWPQIPISGWCLRMPACPQTQVILSNILESIFIKQEAEGFSQAFPCSTNTAQQVCILTAIQCFLQALLKRTS